MLGYSTLSVLLDKLLILALSVLLDKLLILALRSYVTSENIKTHLIT